jgi:hypothetical protein
MANAELKKSVESVILVVSAEQNGRLPKEGATQKDRKRELKRNRKTEMRIERGEQALEERPCHLPFLFSFHVKDARGGWLVFYGEEDNRETKTAIRNIMNQRERDSERACVSACHRCKRSSSTVSAQMPNTSFSSLQRRGSSHPSPLLTVKKTIQAGRERPKFFFEQFSELLSLASTLWLASHHWTPHSGGGRNFSLSSFLSSVAGFDALASTAHDYHHWAPPLLSAPVQDSVLYVFFFHCVERTKLGIN